MFINTWGMTILFRNNGVYYWSLFLSDNLCDGADDQFFAERIRCNICLCQRWKPLCQVTMLPARYRFCWFSVLISNSTFQYQCLLNVKLRWNIYINLSLCYCLASDKASALNNNLLLGTYIDSKSFILSKLATIRQNTMPFIESTSLSSSFNITL